MTTEPEYNASTAHGAAGAVHWVVRHRQQLALALAALAVAGALAVAVVFKLKQLEERAWEQLSYAQSLAAQGRRPEALNTVLDLLKTQRSGPIAVQGHLLKGDIDLQDNRPADALAAYQEALRQSDRPEYQSLSLASVATAFEYAQKWRDAEDAHAQFIKDFPDHPLTPRAYAALGRLQMAQQKWTEAQSTLERLITLYPTTSWAKDAQEYLANVRAQLPKK